MELYQIVADDLIRLPESDIEKEATLEEHLIKSKGAQIGGVELMYIGRQGSPEEGGIFDILGVDENGDSVIVELKRGKAPREIVSQALEYASGIRREGYDHLEQRYLDFYGEHHDETEVEADSPLLLAHAAYFDIDEPLAEREFNANQRLVLVGTSFRDASLNMADFLREHDIDVVCVEYSSYSRTDGEFELLTTDAIRRPLSVEPSTPSRPDRKDYLRLLKLVRGRIYPVLNGMMHIGGPEDIHKAGKRRLEFPSGHPGHPETVRYRFEPRIEEAGTLRFFLRLLGDDEAEEKRVRRVVEEHTPDFEQYRLADDNDPPSYLVSREIPAEADDIAEDLIERCSEEIIMLAETYHPIFVKEFSAET